jgi:hypothetical protein
MITMVISSRKKLGLSLLLWFGIVTGAAPGNSPFSNERTGFSVAFKDIVTPYRVIGVFLLPDETMHIEVIDPDRSARYSLRPTGGTAERVGDKQWRYRAEKRPGFYPAIVYAPDRTDSITLNIFVMVPRSEKKNGYINGYRIGHYPATPLRGQAAYTAPKGFIEVTPENEDTYLSPHFKLKEFLSKQSGGYPKYVVIQERLLLKLQVILERVNEKGYHANTFHIMSGYRTPYYNRAIGNVQYSRHVYGDAADIFIDMREPYGMMDDLNGDGKIDHRDAAIIYDIVEELYPQRWYRPYIGGLGLYKERPGIRGPFVHIDARGNRARWGR